VGLYDPDSLKDEHEHSKADNCHQDFQLPIALAGSGDRMVWKIFLSLGSGILSLGLNRLFVLHGIILSWVKRSSRAAPHFAGNSHEENPRRTVDGSFPDAGQRVT
jgi:hypothetical protein